MNTKQELQKIFRQVLELETLCDPLEQKTCEAWTSLKHMQLILEIEALFNVTFDEEEVFELASFEAFLTNISNKING